MEKAIKRIGLFVGLLLASCAPAKISPAEFAAQCQVLDDYLNPNYRSYHANLEVQYYVRRAPVWVNIQPLEPPQDPRRYSVEQIDELSETIQSHMEKRLKPETISAFKSAQSLEFSWADCAFGPPLLTLEGAAIDAEISQKRATENNAKDEISWSEYKTEADKENARINFEIYRDEWREPRKRDGRIFFYGVSRIGINPDGDEAVFYLENTCQGSLCGTAVIVTMRKVGDKWRTGEFFSGNTLRRK